MGYCFCAWFSWHHDGFALCSRWNCAGSRAQNLFQAWAAYNRSSHNRHDGVLTRVGGVTVSTGSIAAREACRGVDTRNRSQKQ
jgi:hypothetical protein